MAGSNKWFNYSADDGTDWCIFADESNVEAANQASAIAPLVGAKYKVPRNMKVRYAVFGNQSGTRSLKIPITTAIVYNNLTAASSIQDTLPDDGDGDTTLFFIRKRPEIISPSPTIFDTGIDDGDQP